MRRPPRASDWSLKRPVQTGPDPPGAIPRDPTTAEHPVTAPRRPTHPQRNAPGGRLPPRRPRLHARNRPPPPTPPAPPPRNPSRPKKSPSSRPASNPGRAPSRVQGSLLADEDAVIGSKLAGRVETVARRPGLGRQARRAAGDARPQRARSPRPAGRGPARASLRRDRPHARRRRNASSSSRTRRRSMLEQALVDEAQAAVDRGRAAAADAGHHRARVRHAASPSSRRPRPATTRRSTPSREQISLIGVRRTELALARQQLVDAAHRRAVRRRGRQPPRLARRVRAGRPGRRHARADRPPAIHRRRARKPGRRRCKSGQPIEIRVAGARRAGRRRRSRASVRR